ncbi:MAG: FAD-dependent oxidoreductase [Planctomycetota bacterium]|jgi:NADPH-dependent glutamate synthase beta subunit-like oxidoreductase/coenzyme F420-reducing hydrogenase delta subunit
MRDADLTSKDLDKLGQVTELMDREWAPCRYNCPAHADVRGYIEAAAEGRLRDAIDIIRANLPFAAVCGRVCHHPCEANCRRQDVDDPVAIREVKRFVAETQGAAGSTVTQTPAQDKAQVAVIGAGPAGMSAALWLAKAGYRPTVFEKFPLSGGIPATAIPGYRLPQEVVEIDLDWIRAHGVEIVNGVEIGKDRTIKSLLDEGFGAALIATGLSASRPLPMPGADHPRVLGALEFLTDLTFDRKPDVGESVLVIGGGNVACDCARSAVRMGASVRMMCLENEEEMPAWDWERREAEEEGVEITFRRGPVEVLVEGDRITGARTRGVTRVFDEAGRFDPQYDDTDLSDLACDTVIIAIGQTADPGFLEGSGLETDERGRMAYNADTHQTSNPRVFACGEIVTPPGSVVEAGEHARRAAQAIELFLSGEAIDIDDSLPPAIDCIDCSTAEKVLKVDRHAVPTDPADGRRKVFAEFEHTYPEPDALNEARRCMNCGSGAEVLVDKCAACLTCVRVCPFDIPVVTDVARIESTRCQACGICIAECPANAILARGRELDDLVERTRAALSEMGGSPKRIAYVCGYHAARADWAGQVEPVDGVAEIYLPSTSRISAADLLHAFEHGADAAYVVTSPDGTERYPQTAERTRRRVAQAKGLLAEVGIDPEALQLLEVGDRDRAGVAAALGEAAGG